MALSEVFVGVSFILTLLIEIRRKYPLCFRFSQTAVHDINE